MIRAAHAIPTKTPYAQQVETDLLATLQPMGRPGRLWVASLLAVCGVALIALIIQLRNGLRVTGMNDMVSWGVYMTNFVFFIGISHAGTLISAILRVTGAEWRRPITRLAEAITVFALIIGASMIMIDMGRPDRLLNLIFHGRLSSPILWDLCSVTTYLTGSFIYLYVAMIPDMPMVLRDARLHGRSKWLVRFYELLAIGYKGTPAQERFLNRALGAMAVIIIPVAISVHTVVSWIFGMTVRPGWHSTIFGPYFVIGAIFSGTAALITAIALFRRAYRLHKYLTDDCLRKLAALLVALTLLYGYFTLSEYLTTWYGGLGTERRLIDLLMGASPYGVTFWFWAVTGLFIPLGLLIMPSKRSIGGIITASVLINIGMWLKRYLILVPTLETPWIPPHNSGVALTYSPTWVEWAITAGGFAAFMLLYTVFARVFPIVSIWEVAEDAEPAEKVADMKPRERFARPAFVAIRALLLAGGVGALGAVGATTRLQAQAAQPRGAQLVLTMAVVDEEERLVAAVTAAGRPFKGARVAFAVKRVFSPMALGEEVTGADGKASVPFPSTLPGDSTGALAVSAEIISPDRLAGTRGETLMPGAPVVRAEPNEAWPPRALWSTRAPIGVIATLCTLLSVVWCTYVFVIRQLVLIKLAGREERQHRYIR
jgi:molybdopterin-containing oxidoreductase family membrane subunit